MAERAASGAAVYAQIATDDVNETVIDQAPGELFCLTHPAFVERRGDALSSDGFR
jgi:hypothetical protein